MIVTSLTLKQLRAVSEVFRTGGFSAAAGDLHITQSAVSVLIRQAEETLGVRLFDRTTRSLTPTQAAENVVGLIDRMLADLDAIQETARGFRDLERGTVRLTATPATGMTLLPVTVRRFRQAHPNVTLAIRDCAPNRFFVDIAEQRADFGIGTRPSDAALFDWHPLVEDPLCLICSVRHPFARRSEVRWTDLADEPLILSHRDYGVRDAVERTMQAHGLTPRVQAEIGFLGSAAWMSGCDMGMAILPRRLAAAQPTEDCLSIPLVDPVVTRAAGIVSRRGHAFSPAATRFLGMLEEDLTGPDGGRSGELG